MKTHHQVGIPTENVVIEDSIFHGVPGSAPDLRFPCCNSISIGSEMSGGVRNVTVRNVVLRNTYVSRRRRAPAAHQSSLAPRH